MQSAEENSGVGEQPGSDTVTDAEIASRWAIWKLSFDGDVAPMSPEEVMARLPAQERASRIFDVIMSIPMAAGAIDGLVHLIAATGDPGAVSYIAEVYAAAEELVASNLAVNLPNADPERRAGFAQNEERRVRVFSVRAVALIPGDEAYQFLVDVSGDSHAAARAAAVEALESR